MFLSEIPAALLRRWYIFFLGLGLTGAAAAFVASSVEPEYTVTAQTLLLPPATSVPAGGNPYLSLGGLNAVGDILSAAIRDDTNMTALGFTSRENFTFFRDVSSAAPMMIISVTAPTGDTARNEAKAILRRVPAALKELQTKTGVPSDSLITSSVVVNPGEATTSTRTQLRALLATSVVGAALTVLLVAAVDRLLRARSLRRKGRDETAVYRNDAAPALQTTAGAAVEAPTSGTELGAPAPAESTRPVTPPVDNARARVDPVTHTPPRQGGARSSGPVDDTLSDLDAELATDAPRV